MNIALGPAFLLNLMLNSFLSWVLLTGLISALLWLAAPRSPRLRLFLRALPVLKLAVDPFLYRFDKWALAQGVNPLSAAPGTRNIGVWASTDWLRPWGVGLHLESGESFSIADLLITQMPATIATVIAFAVLLITALRVIQVIRRVSAARSLAERSAVPLCYGWLWPVYKIPEASLSGLSDAQVQAIMKHEQQHARWRDPLLLAVLEGLRALYWWLPLGRTMAWIRLEQERDCDRVALKQIDGPDYADALLHVARGESVALCVEADHALSRRIDDIVGGHVACSSLWVALLWGLVGWIFLGARLWMF